MTQENQELTQEQIEQRVAVLKRFKKLLEIQRSKFQEYLNLLEDQEKGIIENNDESILAHAELENQIVTNIASLQKVINPIEDMYKKLGSPVSEEIPKLKNDLTQLQSEVIVQNEKNRNLLKIHMEEIHERMENMNNPKLNPYAKRKNVYAHAMQAASVFDMEV